MNKSINNKILAYFLGLTALVLFTIWIGINFYIEDYYYGKKIETMKETVEELEDSFDSETTEKLVENLEYVGYQFGGKISIYDEGSVITIVSNSMRKDQGVLKKEIRHKNVTAFIYETNHPTKGTKWLIYGEEMNNGKYAVLEIPIESIENTLQIVRRFFGFLVLASTLIAILFSVVLSRNISRPVTQLNNIAKEMSQLNFQHKYNGKRKDEIGQLGQTLNNLTFQLQKTIVELKHELAKEKQLDVLRKSFIAQVSHELQTPLSVIHGYIEALEDEMVETDEEKQYYYEIIEDETSKMSKIVRELLDLSQLEAGTFKMNKENMDPVSLLEDIGNKYEKIAISKGINWKYSGAGESISILGDAFRIEQAITNIINNAFKHTEKGKCIFFLTQTMGNQLNIIIENEGEHIPAEQLSLIWQSFYKGKTSAGKSGTGLGLAIAANIFNAHDFSYQAYNTELGVAFEIIIPGTIL